MTQFRIMKTRFSDIKTAGYKKNEGISSVAYFVMK